MKGATAVPPAKTMITAKKSRTRSKGNSQYFFRFLMNDQRSSSSSIMNIFEWTYTQRVPKILKDSTLSISSS